MLSVFPELLFLSPFSAFLIRVALAAVFAYAAWHHFKTGDRVANFFAVAEAVLAVVIMAGAWTQPAALIGAIMTGLWLWQSTLRPVARGTVFLSLIMCLSLLVTGAGAFAFDWPL
ncbi:MAG: hypothetical protein AAB665_04130 [Patescibacteria group bacterium]